MASLGNSDAPLKSISEDSLGLGEYARALANFISDCETPMTIAVQGDWGTGKTSLMHMVEGLLETSKSRDKIETIWFETWQYSQFGGRDNLPLSLLSTLLSEIGGDEGGLVSSTLNVIKKLARPTFNAGLRFATAGATELQDFGGFSTANPVDDANNAKELKKNISSIVAEKRSKGISRFVIFVDDLDRVVPERAVDLLETIKLFVDLEGCVFVLALDYKVVQRGLQKKFGLDDGILGGRSFFDKIIQLPFLVPTARYTTQEFIGKLFERMQFQAMHKDDQELFSDLSRLSISTNPRAIKRVFNSMQLLLGMAKSTGLFKDLVEERAVIRNLFALLCMQNRFEPIYYWLSFNAERIDEKALRRLEGKSVSEGENDDASFDNALAELGSSDTPFFEFARLFLEAVRSSEDDSEDFSPADIITLKKVLMLTFVTSVALEQQSHAIQLDAEFRWRNREMMTSIQRRMATMMGDSLPIQRYQPQSSEDVYLTRRIDNTKFHLQLIQRKSEICVQIAATGRRLEKWKDKIAEVLEPISTDFRRGSDGGFQLWSVKLDEHSTIDQRETILGGAALEFFKKATDEWSKTGAK